MTEAVTACGRSECEGRRARPEPHPRTLTVPSVAAALTSARGPRARTQPHARSLPAPTPGTVPPAQNGHSGARKVCPSVALLAGTAFWRDRGCDVRGTLGLGCCWTGRISATGPGGGTNKDRRWSGAVAVAATPRQVLRAAERQRTAAPCVTEVPACARPSPQAQPCPPRRAADRTRLWAAPSSGLCSSGVLWAPLGHVGTRAGPDANLRPRAVAHELHGSELVTPGADGLRWPRGSPVLPLTKSAAGRR